MKIVYIKPHASIKSVYEEITNSNRSINRYELASMQRMSDIDILTKEEMEYYKSDDSDLFLSLIEGSPILTKMKDFLFVRVTEKGLYRVGSRQANKLLLNHASLLFNDKSLSNSKISAEYIKQILILKDT